MEESGIAFYDKASKTTSYPRAREMFLSFIEDEKRHRAALKKILTDLQFSNVDQFFGEKPRRRIENIFENAAKGVQERVAANPDELQTLEIGMDMEREGIEFYQTAEEQSDDDDQKAFLKRLVEEEKEHLQLLQNTHSYLKNSGDWFLWEEKGLLDGG